MTKCGAVPENHGTKHTSIALPTALLAEIEEIATREGNNKSTVIRRLLRRGITEERAEGNG